MKNQNPVLVLDTENGSSKVHVEMLSDASIPENLNGESGFHIYHVCVLTKLILVQAKTQGVCVLSDEEIDAISIASSLHDVGKSRVPKSILDYPGKLSPLQYDIIKKHAIFGEEIIREIEFGDIDPSVKKHAMEIARGHHERYDGTGYPDGREGNQIPLSAQVVALADSYDALTSNRSYKDAFSQDVAVQMISSGMCGVFDEALIDCLLKVVNHSSLVALREKLLKKREVVSHSDGFVPERVLCIGNTEYLTQEFIEATFPDSKVMVVGNTELGSADKIKLFRVKKPSIKAIFETYDFDLVVYFSGDLTYQTMEKNDSEELREVLEYAKQMQKRTRMIFLSSLDAAFSEKTDRAILSAAKENLCQFYGKKANMDVKVVRIPYLYSGVYEKDFLYKIFKKLYKKQTVSIEEAADGRMHFLSMKDLSDLLVRLVDNWKNGTGILTVVDEFDMQFSDLAKHLTGLEAQAQVDFVAETPVSRTATENNKALRNEYGWFAKISVLEDLEEEYGKYCAAQTAKVESFWDKCKKWMEEHSLFVKVAELLILFLITELFLLITDSAVIFSIVDFRMVYIVVMATVHGLYFGLMAATLSSISWLIAKVVGGTSMMTIFYEPTNWLAFVFFFLVAALCGYVKLRKDDHIRFVTDQNKLLEDKLVFTREIYEDTYREKRDLKKQIIGSKDSFGKIFDITRKLDTVEPRLLYLRIMETFEEILENKKITVYSINKESTFGRLEVASRDIIDNVSKSISTETYAPVIEKLREGEIWRNTQLSSEYPMYAAGVYRGQELVLLIFLWHADMDQRSLYYVNLFKIMRDLVQMSLLRAYDYNQAVYDRQYIAGTHIMNAAAFAETLSQYRALAEKKVSSYVMFQIDGAGKTVQELEELVSRKIRTTDVLGMTEDGKLRILFAQATENDLQYILPRFEGIEIETTVIQ